MLQVPTSVSQFNTEHAYKPWALVPKHALFDWQGVNKPKIPWQDLVIYELHVRAFTMTSSKIGADALYDGSFAGVIQRIPYLKGLGINCVELLPVMEYNETEWDKRDPAGKRLCQFWGYSTVAFFVPMHRFASNADPHTVVNEFKLMVRELHRAGIEVILDVVYNHTAEMGDDYVGPGFYGMKLLAPFSYYLLKDHGKTFVNHSGCGNTLNCNNVIVQELIHESLRYWAHEMKVDGFRFDLASILCRGTDAEPLNDPPLITRITKDPAMRDVKLIAEPWDCGGLYQVGSFPHLGVWAEWNGKYRDCIRRFIKGDGHMLSEFASRLCGSEDLYGNGRKPFHSVNFITAHDGFSLYDLVSYNEKHNHDNGEHNNDGEAHNNSWNCGVEGETYDEHIKALRERQLKNFYLALLVSAGTPMLNMGDEYAHTKNGNNNTWCQDSNLTHFSWKGAKDKQSSLWRFVQNLVHLRRSESVLKRTHFLTHHDVTWNAADWNSGYNFVAFTLKGDTQIFIAFNAGGDSRSVNLPHVHGMWGRVIDTNLPSPKDFMHADVRQLAGGSSYTLHPYSAILLRQMNNREWRMDVPDIAGCFEAMKVPDE